MSGTSGARTLNVVHGSGSGGGGIPRLSNEEKNSDLKIYPNPATNILNIDLKNKDKEIVPGNKIFASLYDALGKEIQSVEVLNSFVALNVEYLAKGIYTLRINIDGDIESHQIYID